MLRITEDDYKTLVHIIDGYTDKLNNLSIGSEEYNYLKHELDNQLCSLNLLTEYQIIHAELDIGNVIINNDVLTCIYDNKLHKYKMVHRKANIGDIVYINNATDTCPFNKRYIGRCFKVSNLPDSQLAHWVKDCVCVNIKDLDSGWLLYDDQYVVLEEILNN